MEAISPAMTVTEEAALKEPKRASQELQELFPASQTLCLQETAGSGK